MGYWVLDQNEDYKKYYAGFNSKIRNSIRLESVLKRIKRYHDNLIRWGLAECVEEVFVDTRNGQKTFLYRFTNLGYIIAWAVEYCKVYNGFPKLGKSDRVQTLSMMKKIKYDIFKYIKRLFSEFNSPMIDFLLEFYDKCMKYDISNNCPFVAANENGRGPRIGLFDQIILTLVHGLSEGNFQFPHGIEYLSAAHTFILTNKETAYVALRLYFMALDEFPDNTRDMIMALEKAQIEDELVKSQPSRDWTQVWLENKSDHEILVLYSVCQNKDCLARCRPGTGAISIV